MQSEKNEETIILDLKTNEYIIFPKNCEIIQQDFLIPISFSAHNKREITLESPKISKNQRQFKRKIDDQNEKPQMIKKQKSSLGLSRKKIILEIIRLREELRKIEEVNMDSETKKAERNKKLEEEVEELDYLISKWRKGCQNAIIDLKNMLNEYNAIKLSDMVNNLHIDPKLLGFNAENEDFE